MSTSPEAVDSLRASFPGIPRAYRFTTSPQPLAETPTTLSTSATTSATSRLSSAASGAKPTTSGESSTPSASGRGGSQPGFPFPPRWLRPRPPGARSPPLVGHPGSGVFGAWLIPLNRPTRLHAAGSVSDARNSFIRSPTMNGYRPPSRALFQVPEPEMNSPIGVSVPG